MIYYLMNNVYKCESSYQLTQQEEIFSPVQQDLGTVALHHLKYMNRYMDYTSVFITAD